MALAGWLPSRKITQVERIVLDYSARASAVAACVSAALPGPSCLILDLLGLDPVRDQQERMLQALEAALALAEAVAVVNAQDEALIIGGAEIYAQTLAQVSRMYITEVETTVDGDAFFPEFDRDEWRELSRERHHDEASDLWLSFVVYERI